METLAGAGTGGRLLAILLIAGCLTSARTSSSQCEFVTRSESLGVSPNVEENLREIQVRHNLKVCVLTRLRTRSFADFCVVNLVSEDIISTNGRLQSSVL